MAKRPRATGGRFEKTFAGEQAPMERPPVQRQEHAKASAPPPSKTPTTGAPPVAPAPVRRARSPFLWVRRLLLALGVVTLATLALMLAAFQFGRTDRGDELDEVVVAQGDEETLTSGEGFDYTQWSDGRRVFRIRSERSQQNRDETVSLEAVTLDIFRQDGDIYTITSSRARVNEGTWAAELEGNVVLGGWGDLELRARALELQRNGEVLVSKGAVEFSYPPDIVGRATKLRLDRREDVVSLSGGVHIRSTPQAETPLRLDGERLVYRRGENMLRVLDDVFARQGGQTLRSRSLTLLLEDDQKTVRTLRARWDVRADLESELDDGGFSRVRLEGELLEIEPEPEHREDYRLELEGAEGIPAKLAAIDEDGMARSLVGVRLNARTSAGQLEMVEGEGAPLVLDEYLDLPEPFLLRQACARRAVARFLLDGEIGHLVLDEQVELRDISVQVAGGQRAVLDGNTGVLDITGPAVELFDRRGQVTAPKVSYTRDTGLIRAAGGVRTAMTDGAGLSGTPFGTGGGPLRVESQEALWTEVPPTFSFRGGVRAWKGQNLLLADQVRGDQAGNEMAASGGVKTVWVPTGANLETAERQPVAVESDRMTFRQDSHEIVYQEDVRIVQNDRTIRCEELNVSLTPGSNEAERLQCRGEVLLLDPAAGRRVTGDLAIFEVAVDRVEVFGEEVKLVDASRSSMTGKYLSYDLNAGSVELKSRPPAGTVASTATDAATEEGR